MKKLILVSCIVCALSTAAFAQTRKRSTKRSAATPASANTSQTAAVRTEGATLMATQIKNLTIFMYLLGGVVNDIEPLDAQAKSGLASTTQQRQKAELKPSLADFR